MKAWLKGGLWGLGIGVVLFFCLFILIFFCGAEGAQGSFFCNNIENISNITFFVPDSFLDTTLIEGTPLLLLYLFSTILEFFLIGAIISWIVGKIRNRNQNQ